MISGNKRIIIATFEGSLPFFCDILTRVLRACTRNQTS
jgi:hypothetical protein